MIEQATTFRIGGDLEVNRLGFGAMRITGPGIWGEPTDPAEAAAVLRRAVELGVNFIDTADAYGPDVSERIIGDTLSPYPADLVVATKGGNKRSGPDQWYQDGRPEALREAIEGSLQRLKLETIPLYQLHRIDPKVPADDQLGTLADLQRQGKFKHFGLSEVTVAEIEHAQTILPVVSVQNRYAIGDHQWEDILDYCEANNIAFIPWFPLGAGKLAAPGGALEQIAQKYGATSGQIALAWLLKRSPVVLPIPGTSKVKHLEENMGAASIQLSDADFEALKQAANA
jgi:pyridoxine 4-dehydrogenase